MEKTALEKLDTKFIFSIEGNIGAGKSTIIKYLQRLYKDVILVEEPVSDWQNIGGKNLLNLKNNCMERWGYSFESFVLVTKMNELVKYANSKIKIILIERCMLTDKAFFDVNVANGLTSPMEEAMFNRFYEFLSNVAYPKLSGIIYVDTPVDECIKRIQGRGRREEQGLSKEYMEQLHSAFLKVINDSGVPILRIDGLYDLQNDIDLVGQQLTEFISSKIK